MAMHLAESREELQLLSDGTGPFQELLEERSMWDAEAIPRGSRPLDYLRMLAEATASLVIHGNYLDEDELEYLAGATASECHSCIARGRTPISSTRPIRSVKRIAAGVRVALGTDSRASNPDLRPARRNAAS